MGWGTFIAGQAVSMVRRAGKKGNTAGRRLTAAEQRELLQQEAREKRSTVGEIVLKTPLIHPDIAANVDMEYWEARIWHLHKRHRGFWQFLFATPAVAGFFYVFANDLPDTNLWSFLAVAAAGGLALLGLGAVASEAVARNLVARYVRKFFWAEGHDVAQLMLEAERRSQAATESQVARSRAHAEAAKARLKRERFGK